METGIGERFARALASRDATAVKALLAPDVDFKGLTPGAFWESNSSDEVVDDILYSEWFETDDKILGVLSVEGGEVGERQHVAYRFALERPDGPFQVEQQAYFNEEGGKITLLRILCSGYQAIDLP